MSRAPNVIVVNRRIRVLFVHNGSNGMNLATILVDPERDLGIVGLTNFPEQKADDALRTVLVALYRRFGG